MGMKRTSLLTGGCRGIGAAIAECRRRGPRSPHAHAGGTRSRFARLDQAYLPQAHLAPDILINNAGVNKINPLETLPLEDWQSRAMNINLTAPFLLTQAVAGADEGAGAGAASSTSAPATASSPARGRMAYTRLEAGPERIDPKRWRWNSRPYNILVNAICPGFVETDMTRPK